MRRRLAVAVGGVGLLVAAWSGRASAQVEPPPPDSPTTTAAPPAAAAADDVVKQTSDDVRGVLFGPQVGDYPDDRYKFYTGDGHAKLGIPNVPGPVDDIARAVTGNRTVTTPAPTDDTVVGTLIGIGWEILQMFASITRDFIGWLFSFAGLRVFTPVVENVAGLLDGAVVGPLRLREFVAFLCGLSLCWSLLRHRRFGTTIVNTAVALLLFAGSMLMILHPAVYFDGIANFAAQVTQLPFRLINPDDADAGRNTAMASMKKIQTTVPWEIINFDHQLDGACIPAGNDILANGPYGQTDNQPRETMLKAGCKTEAKFNNEPTPYRIALLALLAVMVVFTSAFLAAMAWTMLHAFASLAWHACYGGFALLFGSIPQAREFAARWIHGVLDDFVALVVPSWVLAAMLVADTVLLRPDVGAIGTTVQLLLVGVVNGAIFWKRKKIVNRVAATLSGSVGRVSAKVVQADQSVEARRRREDTRSARDYMGGHALITAPAVATGAALATQVATGGKKIDAARNAAAKTVGGPAGKTIVAARKSGAKARQAAGEAKDAASSAGTAVLGVSQRVGAAAASRGAAVSDAAKGTGTAPLGDVHGPEKPKASPDADLLPGWDETQEQSAKAAADVYRDASVDAA